MRYRFGILAGMAAAVVLAAGCGSSSSSSSTPASGGAATTVHTARSSSLGADLLVNAKGMTLYTLSAERGGKFICTKGSTIPGGNVSCLSVWKPLTVASGTRPAARWRWARWRGPTAAAPRSPTTGCRSTPSPTTRRPVTRPATDSRTWAPGRRRRWARRPPPAAAAAGRTATEPRMVDRWSTTGIAAFARRRADAAARLPHGGHAGRAAHRRPGSGGALGAAGAAAGAAGRPAPAGPSSFDDLLDQLERDVLPYVARISHPGYLAFVPGEGTWPGALGDFISSALNVDTCWWLGASGPAALELVVLDWIPRVDRLPARRRAACSRPAARPRT